MLILETKFDVEISYDVDIDISIKNNRRSEVFEISCHSKEGVPASQQYFDREACSKYESL
jgi:hypothetical protein